MGNEGYSIKFEEQDTDTEKRIVEQGCAFIRNLLVRFNEVKAETQTTSSKDD
jgi:hypothetical protein